MGKNTTIALTYFFSCIGISIQVSNLAYASYHYYKKRTPFNALLVFAMFLYSTTYIPLFITTYPAIMTSGEPEYPGCPMEADFVKVRTALRAWHFLYGLTGVTYLSLVQMRFTIIRTIWKYEPHWDKVMGVVTFTIYICTNLTFSVIYPINATSVNLAAAAWTAWILIIDNFSSGIFLTQLFKSRQSMGIKSKPALFKRVTTALFFLCGMSWTAFLTSAIGFLGVKDGEIRTLVFRVAYAITPLQFAGAMVFMYGVRELVAVPQNRLSFQQKSSTGTTSSANNSMQRLRPIMASSHATEGDIGTLPRDLGTTPKDMGTIPRDVPSSAHMMEKPEEVVGGGRQGEA